MNDTARGPTLFGLLVLGAMVLIAFANYAYDFTAFQWLRIAFMGAVIALLVRIARAVEEVETTR